MERTSWFQNTPLNASLRSYTAVGCLWCLTLPGLMCVMLQHERGNALCLGISISIVCEVWLAMWKGQSWFQNTHTHTERILQSLPAVGWLWCLTLPGLMCVMLQHERGNFILSGATLKCEQQSRLCMGLHNGMGGHCGYLGTAMFARLWEHGTQVCEVCLAYAIRPVMVSNTHLKVRVRNNTAVPYCSRLAVVPLTASLVVRDVAA